MSVLERTSQLPPQIDLPARAAAARVGLVAGAGTRDRAAARGGDHRVTAACAARLGNAHIRVDRGKQARALLAYDGQRLPIRSLLCREVLVGNLDARQEVVEHGIVEKRPPLRRGDWRRRFRLPQFLVLRGRIDSGPLVVRANRTACQYRRAGNRRESRDFHCRTPITSMLRSDS